MRVRASAVALLLTAALMSTGGSPVAAQGPAQAVVEQRLSLQDSVTLDGNAHAWNTLAFDQHKALTHGKFQYISYWNAETNLVLARRDVKNNDVQRLVFPDQIANPGDSHRSTTLGMSLQDGRLHLSYDHHNNRINYRKSVAGFLSSPPEQLSLEHFSAKESMLDDPALDDSATYPRFVNDSAGNLYFVFRRGGSGNGDTLLRRYDPASATWEQIGMLVSRVGTYPEWDNSTSRNAYINGISFDDNDRLHLSWIFRETGSTPRSNHDIHYAYSDDFGETWFNNDGRKIADLPAGDPISLDDPGIVAFPVPVDAGLRGQTGMAFDSRNQPHIFSTRSTVVSSDQSEWNLHYVHYWRSPDGAWHESVIDDPEVDVIEPMRRGDILLDRQDNVHVLFGYGDELLTARGAASSGWSDWSFYRLTDDTIAPLSANNGVHYDRRLFAREGVVSVLLETVAGTGRSVVMRDFSIEPVEVEEPGEPPRAPALTVRLDEARVPHHGEARPGDLGLVLSWDTVNSASSYDIYRRTAGGADELIADDFGAGSFVTDFVDTDIVPGVEYVYEVQAANRFGQSDRSNPIRAIIHDRGEWTDYTVDFDMSGPTDTTNLIFRIQDDCNMYAWHVRTRGTEDVIRPVRIADCAQTRIAADLPVPFELAPDQSYHFRFQVVGDTVTVWIDDQLIGSVSDSAYTAGTIGLRSSLASSPPAALIDNVVVTDTGGQVLYADDFSSGLNPFEPHGPRACAGDASDGVFAMRPGDWCVLPRYAADIGAG